MRETAVMFLLFGLRLNSNKKLQILNNSKKVMLPVLQRNSRAEINAA